MSNELKDKSKTFFIVSIKSSCQSSSASWLQKFSYETDLVGLPIITFLLILCWWGLLWLLCIVVRFTWWSVTMPAGRTGSRVSYLVCHWVWIEELASYLDREVWRGALPTATNATLFKVHRAVKKKKNHTSCKIVCRDKLHTNSKGRGRAHHERKVSDLSAWKKTTAKFMTVALQRENRLWFLVSF